MAWDWEKLKEQQTKRKPQPPPPPGQGSGGGGQEPPNWEEILNKFKGSKLPDMWWLVVVAACLLGLFVSSVYTIAPNEEGVIQRFGKHVRTTGSGPHMKMPFGIENVRKVLVDYRFTESFGINEDAGDVGRVTASEARTGNVSLMLTGDLNVAKVPWSVQFRIKDSYNYCFKVQNPTSTLRDLSEATMRLVVGDSSVDEVLTKRDMIATEFKTLLQKELDEAETGFEVTTVNLEKTMVPEPVQPAYNEENRADQEKQTIIYQAQEQYNKAIPAAQGDAQRVIRAAEGYELDRVNRAQGDASRFVSLYEEYQKTPEVTRRRLYLEAIGEVLPGMGDKYIVDSDQKNLLPFLNLAGKGEVIK
ncbi:MAG: FtsH protease activity modulator HflK [Desulfatibacillum sp.]|nr:FtsH protease activity modulator HflK [Desulfatibacillum sp.]